MFEVSAQTIDRAFWSERLNNPKAGSSVVFEGLVRNHNEGLPVKALEYECFEALAYLEADTIIAEAKRKFKVYDIFCVHRTGLLEIGELAVWIGVTSAHRQAAFAACQYMIDELKTRLPIWKKEYYLNQAPEWVNCQQCAAHNHAQAGLAYTEHDYYRRQNALPEMRAGGQDKLNSASVLVIGAGGLGSPALAYLAAAGVGRLGICDGDLLDVSNLHRQVLYQYSDIDAYKADRAAAYLRAANPFIDVIVHREQIDCENAARLIQDYDLVLDCTDNFATKFLIHDACFFQGTPLIQASIYQFEGQLQLYRFGADDACLRCLWPQQPEADCVGSCAEAGVLGVAPGILGTWQASEALKLILGLAANAPSETLMINLLSNEVFKLAQQKNKECPLCGADPSIQSIEAETYAASAAEQPDWECSAPDLFASETDSLLVDIRSEQERELAEDWQTQLKWVPLAELAAYLEQQPLDKKIVLVCQQGKRSYQATADLRAQGYDHIYSLRSGVGSLKPFLKNKASVLN